MVFIKTNNLLETYLTTVNFLLLIFTVVISWGVYYFLEKAKNKRKLLKYLSEREEIKDIKFNDRFKQVRIVLFDISKNELLNFAKDVYSIDSSSIKDMKITYDEDKSIDNPFVITISFKEKFSIEGYGYESVSLTGAQQNGFKEYGVSFKYGGEYYDENGDTIFCTNISHHLVYKLKNEPNRWFKNLFEL